MSEVIRKVNMEHVCTCLVCGKSFPARDIRFAMELPASSGGERDEGLEKALSQYKAITGSGEDAIRIPSRYYFSWTEADVLVTEGEEDQALPLIINGRYQASEIKTASKRSRFVFSEDTEEDDSESEDIQEEKSFRSSLRLCPFCHMTLPAGFMTDPVRRIGLLGGSRCGKTTYMIIACKYMENRFDKLDSGLDLGSVKFLPECRQYLNALYESQREAAGAAATEMKQSAAREKPVFPMIAHITPNNKSYKPFFLAIQDIPGEYMLPGNEDHLAASPIPRSTDIISIVDINSLTRTKGTDDSTYGDVCQLHGKALYENFGTLGHAMDEHNTLESFQVCITKVDLWVEQDAGITEQALFTRPGDDSHTGGIDADRMDLIDLHIRKRLAGLPEGNASELLNIMLRELGKEGQVKNQAYVGVSSRFVPGSEASFTAEGISYKQSLNVLEPLLNIARWADLLPLAEKEDVVIDIPVRRKWWQFWKKA